MWCVRPSPIYATKSFFIPSVFYTDNQGRFGGCKNVAVAQDPAFSGALCTAESGARFSVSHRTPQGVEMGLQIILLD